MLRGLTDVPGSALTVLVRLAHRGEVGFPLTIAELTRVGLQYCAGDLLAHLRGLEREAALAVLTAALAEREAARRLLARAEVNQRAVAAIAAADAIAPDEPLTVVLASRNLHKVEELTRMAPQIRWLPLPEELGDPPETGATFEANALQKARYGAAHAAAIGALCLADDSGLEVDALGGRPGVWSKRYAPEATDRANNALLLVELDGVPDARRTARYRCVIALVDGRADGRERLFDGRCEGRIGHAPQGTNGFGYDPLFLPTATPGRTMAELAPAEKDAISHRGAALRALIAILGSPW